MHNKSILNENKCCNGVMGFNMIASCVCSSLLPLMKTYELEWRVYATLPPVDRSGTSK